MRKEVVVSVADLRYVRIECPHCRTKVVLDMREKSAFAEKHGFFTPKTCPGCMAEYDSAVRHSLDALQKLYGPLLEMADTITFHGEAVE